MNKATREVVKKHLKDKVEDLRMLDFNIRQDEISLERSRTLQETLAGEIEALRADLIA